MSHPESPAGHGPDSSVADEASVAAGTDGPADDAGGLVGRQRETVELMALVHEPGLVTVTGPAGVGKTGLVREVAMTASAGFGGGRWMIDLSGIDDAAAVVPAVAAGLGALGEGAADAAALAECLQGRRLLLVVDSCELIADECAALADRLVGAVGGLTLVTTSRQPLGTRNERVLRLAPLSVPPPGESSPRVLGRFDSVRLFLRRRDRSGAGVELTDDVASLVAEICRATDGLPRYIEGAADAVHHMDVGQLNAALEGGCPAADLERSLRMLRPAEGRLLRYLSAFVGGWTLDDAGQVCDEHGSDGAEVAAAHRALVAKSLITESPVAKSLITESPVAESPVAKSLITESPVAQTQGSASRYSMLETTRRLVALKTAAEGESEGVRRRHARWCLSLVEGGEAAELVVAADEAWLRRLDPEMENFRAALAWARDGGDVELGVRLASALTRYWTIRGHLHEAREWMEWAMAHDHVELDPRLRATLARRAAVVHGRLGDAATARALVEQATALFREVGEAEGASAACAFISLNRRPRELVPGLDRSVGLAHQAGDITALGYLLSTRAQAQLFMGRLEAARADFAESVALGRREHHGDVLRMGLFGLARVDLAAGSLPTAARELGDAQTLAERTDDHPGRGLARALCGELARLGGDYGRARQLLDASVEMVEALGEPLPMARNLLFLARLEHASGTPARAAVLSEEALALGRSADGPPYHESRCLLILAACAFEIGDLEKAERLADQARVLAEANDDRLAIAEHLRFSARCGRLGGRSSGTELRMCQDSLRLYASAGSLPGVVGGLEEAAALFADRSLHDLAARLLAAAEAARETSGLVRAPVEEGDHARVVDAVAEALGPQWDRARIEGHTLSAAEAVTAACENRGRQSRESKGWASLTRAEQNVARLVAAGLTSAEAAARLYVSRRTIETHLGHVYTKLEIHSRKALAGFVDGGARGHAERETGSA